MRQEISAAVDEARMHSLRDRLVALPFLSGVEVTGLPGAYVIHFTAGTAEALRAVRHEIMVP